MFRRVRLAAFATVVFWGAPSAADDERCSLPGEPIQWIADYCMLSLETDDEIAASACIDEYARRAFPGACATKRYFKGAMCELAVARRARADTKERCVSDPAFMGRAVRNNGVGS